MRIEVAGTTHVGMKRGHNEDNFILLPDERLFGVADGMGGHAAGEVASKLALEELAEFFRLTREDRELTWPFKMDRELNYSENRLATAIQLANRRIFEQNHADAAHPRDMGTTIVTVFVEDGAAYLGHVGDSRAYVFQNGALRQLTEDHSLVWEYVKAGKLRPEEAATFPYRNVILRALGQRDSVPVDITRYAPQAGDVLLLCSDGLSGMLDDGQMQQILAATPDLERCAQDLIDAANAAGGTDNITCVLLRFAA